MAAGGTN